jgi:NADPH:quinone reductase-like Zn-dependent oxidoreductase
VTIVSKCDEEQVKKRGIACKSLSSHPDPAELRAITNLIDAGKIKPVVSQVLPLADAAKATAQAETHHTRGKIVLKIADEPKP